MTRLLDLVTSTSGLNKFGIFQRIFIIFFFKLLQLYVRNCRGIIDNTKLVQKGVLERSKVFK